MSLSPLDARGLFSLLFHGDKAIDVVDAAFRTGLLARLDDGPVTLGELSERLEMIPGRLDKLLECLESLGLVQRLVDDAHPLLTSFVSIEPLARAAELVLGPDSIEHDRNSQPWRRVYERLPDVLRGGEGITEEDFAWPPKGEAQLRRFEQSMSLGIGPIAESFAAVSETLFGSRPLRMLDVGGGDGTLAVELVANASALHVAVYNLPETAALVQARLDSSPHRERLSFVGGDFRGQGLPAGYDVISFVRVLHDWPDDEARRLIDEAHAALPHGGRLIICEELRTPAALALQFFWSYFLIGVDQCHSRLRSLGRYADMLRDAGFDALKVRSGPFDIVVAHKGEGRGGFD